MANSQLYIAYKTSNGQFTVKSAHTTDHAVPTFDAQQNLAFISGYRDNSKTVVTFKRKLNTGNSKDKILRQGVATDLIWAYGDSDTLKHHVEHGYKSVIF